MPTHLKKPPPPPVLLPIQLLRRKEATAVARASCLACGWRHASSYASPRAAWTAEHVCVRVCVCVCVCARAHARRSPPTEAFSLAVTPPPTPSPLPLPLPLPLLPLPLPLLPPIQAASPTSCQLVVCLKRRLVLLRQLHELRAQCTVGVRLTGARLLRLHEEPTQLMSKPSS